MSIRISGFAGEIPRVISRLLPSSAAQVTRNVKVEDGSLVPIRLPRLAHYLDAPAQTIYLHQGDWLSWDVPVRVVPAPIADDRLYVTGDGPPKLIAAGTTYGLAVTPPATGPAIALVSGSPDTDLEVSLVYAYTWVTIFDEESEPSPVSNELLWSDGLNIIVSGFTAPPAGRGINRMRIYRSQTSALGDTELYFIAERAVSTADFHDIVATNPIQELIPSQDYNAPPDGLSGVVVMPNGMMAAFVGKSLYFCEPYHPHAWPEKYVLTVDYEIVGLGVFGSAVAVMTRGRPYIAAGTSPDTMTMEKLEVNLPCLAARGIVDLGSSIAYPSPDGLVIINQGGAQLVSSGLYTRDQWLRLNPGAFVAGSFAGRYLTACSTTDAAGNEQRCLLVIDMSSSQPFVTRSDGDATAMFRDTTDGVLYLLIDGQTIQEWDAASMPPAEMTWRSKSFVLPGHTNFGVILVEGEVSMTDAAAAAAQAANTAVEQRNASLIAMGTDQGALAEAVLGSTTVGGSLIRSIAPFSPPSFAATVYADGRPVATCRTLNTPIRMPGGFLALTWEIEITGTATVETASLAYSPADLASA